MAEGDLLTTSDIARLAGVSLAAVSNWRRRHQDFPRPPEHQSRVAAGEVAAWLDGRTIAANDLGADEPPGTNYGQRFRRNMSGTSETPPDAGRLWRVLDPLRGTTDDAMLVDVALGLLALSVARQGAFNALTGLSDDQDIATELRRHDRDQTLRQLATAAERVSVNSRGRLMQLVRLIDRGRRSGQGGPEWTVAAFDVMYDGVAGLEGRRGAEFDTPAGLVELMTALTDPGPGDRVLDPCCGAGRFLVAAAGRSAARLAGQTIDERSFRLAGLSLAVRRQRAELSHGIALTHDRYAGQEFDVVMTNPPFNLSVGPNDPDDSRWRFGRPSAVNANFAWLQHAVAHLAKGGRAAIVMPTSAASSGNRSDAATRRAMVDAGVVKALVTLPAGLFAATTIPVTVWVLCSGRELPAEVLFIDASQYGERSGRTRRILGSDDIERISGTYHGWCTGSFEAIPGFAASATIEDISLRQYRLAPPMYIDTDSEPMPTVGDVRRQVSELAEFDERVAAIDIEVARRLEEVLRWTR